MRAQSGAQASLDTSRSISNSGVRRDRASLPHALRETFSSERARGNTLRWPAAAAQFSSSAGSVDQLSSGFGCSTIGRL